jgi:hypothetical protein
MNAFEIYQLYLALKLHFTDESYDFHRYHGKVKANAATFDGRRDKYFFEKLAKHSDPQGFLVANIISDRGGSYIRDLAYGEQSKKVYADWLKIKESLTYQFTNDINKLPSDLKSCLSADQNNHPQIIKMYLSNKISLETLCILVDVTKSLEYWDKKLVDDIVYKDIGMLIKKYTPFIVFERENIKTIVRKKLKGGP